jgi:FtsZ-interacting cell division protein ZipA
MDKKKILIIVGVVAVIGIAYYMYNKNKKSAEGGAEGGAEAPTDATTKSADAPADANTPAKAPLTNRKEKKQACGRKPLNKKKKAEWQKCVDAGGVASFEGSDFDQWENYYMDFSGLNLDL